MLKEPLSKDYDPEVHRPVLDDPILLPIHVLSFKAVSHDQHAVVQLLAAALLFIIDS